LVCVTLAAVNLANGHYLAVVAVLPALYVLGVLALHRYDPVDRDMPGSQPQTHDEHARNTLRVARVVMHIQAVMAAVMWLGLVAVFIVPGMRYGEPVPPRVYLSCGLSPLIVVSLLVCAVHRRSEPSWVRLLALITEFTCGILAVVSLLNGDYPAIVTALLAFCVLEVVARRGYDSAYQPHPSSPL
jgi:NAD/NADP transhydrogenase beta subunit